MLYKKILCELEIAKNDLQSRQTKINDLEFDALRKLEKQVSIASIRDFQNKSLTLLHDFLKVEEDTLHDRIIIGAGAAATAVYAELPKQLRLSKNENNLPLILVLNDPENLIQWEKDLIDGDIVMAREEEVQTPQIFSHRPNDYIEKNSKVNDLQRNPYHYVMTSNFNLSQIETQIDLDMPLLHIKAIKIERKDDTHSKNWKDARYPLRIKVLINNLKKYMYAQHLDICTGLGIARQLNSNQIATSLAIKLKRTNQLIYGQDQGNAKLEGRVIFYGGSARNATMIADRLLTRSSIEIIWIARKESDFNQTKKLSRLYNDLFNCFRSKITMRLGNLERVEQLANGKLRINFSNTNLHEQNLECDQLVISIGQVLNPLIQNLKDFFSISYRDHSNNIPLGTLSKDKRIICWGAAGSIGIGLSSQEQLSFTKNLTAFTNTLPAENQSNGNVYVSAWTINKMISQLRQDNVFPTNEDSPGKIDLPDINSATYEELIQIGFQKTSREESKLIAEQIIRERSMKPLGIENVDQLSHCMPTKILPCFAQIFFPFINRAATVRERSESSKYSQELSVLTLPDGRGSVNIP